MEQFTLYFNMISPSFLTITTPQGTAKLKHTATRTKLSKCITENASTLSRSTSRYFSGKVLP